MLAAYLIAALVVGVYAHWVLDGQSPQPNRAWAIGAAVAFGALWPLALVLAVSVDWRD